MSEILRVVSRALTGHRFASRCILHCVLALWALGATAVAGTTQYYYDDLGRIVQAIGPDGSFRRYRYDQNGNATAIYKISGHESYNTGSGSA